MIGGIRKFPHDLVERVESGSGADRGLDADIGCAVDGWTGHPTFGMAGNTYALYRQDGLAGVMPSYTASLDAVVLLIEQKLPGWGHCYATGWDAEGNCGGFVSPERTVDLTKAIMGVAKTPARTLLAACLRAIQALART